MHFRKKALKQISLDEPSSHDAKMVRREYGSRDGRLSGSVDRITLTRAIKDLPAGYRTIFLLHEVEGYEHQEIAKILECSVGNSKSQLHKAKLRIREFLAEPGKNGDSWSRRRKRCRRMPRSRQRKNPRSELGRVEQLEFSASVPLVQKPQKPCGRQPSSLVRRIKVRIALPHEPRSARAPPSAVSHAFDIRLALAPFQLGAQHIKECSLGMQQRDLVL